MLNIKRFTCNMLQENCYVVSDETKECMIVDCGAFYPEERQAIVDYIRTNNLKPMHLVATHGHFDHNFGNDTIYKEFGMKPEIHRKDERLLQTIGDQAMTIVGANIDAEMPAAGRLLSENDTIEFGSHKFVVIETPGHSPGGVFYYCKEENVAFSGDTLFKGSIGRTDFMGGSMFMLIQSLRMISQMPDEVKLLPGHGPETSIGEEVAHNPYIDR